MIYKIISVGKWRNSGEKELFLEYEKRLSSRLVLKELTPPKLANAEQQKQAEAKLLLNEVSAVDLVVALDEHGKMMSSLEFAAKMEEWEREHKTICFLIGGAFGLGADVLARANFTLALGKMTLPHILARIVLVEQIYRAETIKAGHPYHKE